MPGVDIQRNVAYGETIAMLGFSKEMIERLVVKKEALKCSGKIFSEQHKRKFEMKDDVLGVENDPDDESRLNLTVNRKPIADWFREQWHKLRYGIQQPQQLVLPYMTNKP